jgi:hypothetical protein
MNPVLISIFVFYYEISQSVANKAFALQPSFASYGRRLPKGRSADRVAAAKGTSCLAINQSS